jgi:hypothetical protein
MGIQEAALPKLFIEPNGYYEHSSFTWQENLFVWMGEIIDG